MKILFLGYRDWALQAFKEVAKHPKIDIYKVLHSQSELKLSNLEEFDLLITLGWSDELGPDVCKRIRAIGLHCAELDRYSYGTPLQLQIIDRILKTKHRIFPFVYLDSSKRAHTHTREFSHEVDLYLHGDIENIFFQLTATSIVLLNSYLDDYPNISYRKWPAETIVREKRTPADSKIKKEDLPIISTEELYNLIRSLGGPYPHAYIEDEVGKLYFERVRFKKK
jgi:hypothetical protein